MPTLVRLNLTKLLELERTTGTKADDLVGKLAYTCVAEIVENFSTQSPSEAGEPPGIDTGALKNSIEAKPVKPLTWSVHDGVDYGAYLEWGTSRMAARPFFLPAVERTGQIARKQGLLKKVIE